MCVISPECQGLRTEIYVLHQSTLGTHDAYELLSELRKKHVPVSEADTCSINSINPLSLMQVTQYSVPKILSSAV